ncbi:MAG: NADH:flavin oxidoreductase/NADH oxidase [Firmicutes bacterium]|nr:NADH:flavin oxidoreductase/NADH oxidase [Bacillota bacterium]
MANLYSTGTIGKLKLRNRLVMTPMHLAYCPQGQASDRVIEFYRRRAQGGVGLIIVGAVGIDPVRINQHGMFQIYNDSFIPGLRRLTGAVQAEGAKIFPQLFHAGRYARSSEHGGLVAVAPSAVPSRFTGETPQELTEPEIKEIIDYFAAAARRAKQAGFDGVEIVGSAGYLIAEFLSPLTNLRQDRYGGDLEGRMTFALEVVAAVRQAVGADFPIMMRIAGHDFMNGGNTNYEARKIAVKLEAAGVDALNVTGGWHETQVPQLTMEVPLGAFSYLGAAIKQSVAIPVVVCNRMNVQLAEKIVTDGNADFIGIARGFAADPDLANKAKARQYDNIRPCVACNQGCMDNIFFGKQLSCLANSEAGREKELESIWKPGNDQTASPEKILVIGAGVAGLEYARVAASRGHSVTIWEQHNLPGGQARLAAAAPGRQEFIKLVNYLTEACWQLKVNIIYDRTATAAAILAISEKFDRVIIASGATPVETALAIEPGANVVQAWDVLKDKVPVGKQIVIVGGGAVGVDTALKLAQIGTIDPETLRFLMLNQAEPLEELYRLLTHGSKTVTLVEQGKGIGKGIGPSTRWATMADLKRFNVITLAKTQVIAIKSTGVLIVREENEELLPADTVVLAIGSVANKALYTELQGKLAPITVIGDAQEPRKIYNAIREAYTEACRLPNLE